MRKIRMSFSFRWLPRTWLFLLLLTGCQLPVANTMRDELFPKDTVIRIALFPVLVPMYTVGCAGDLFLFNPIRGAGNVPEVVQTIWEWQSDSSWGTKALLVPVKAIATPPAALGTVLFSEQFIYEGEDTGEAVGF